MDPRDLGPNLAAKRRRFRSPRRRSRRCGMPPVPRRTIGRFWAPPRPPEKDIISGVQPGPRREFGRFGVPQTSSGEDLGDLGCHLAPRE